MDKTQLILAMLGSAGVGALVSSVITFVGQTLERKARQKELALTIAADFSKTYVTRVAEYAPSLTLLPELATLELTYKIIGQVLETGELTTAQTEQLRRIVNDAAEAAEKRRRDPRPSS